MYIEIFNELASNNSRLFKEEVLMRYKDDETLKQIFFMGLDPFTNFWIRKIPEYISDGFEEWQIPIEWCMDALGSLSDRTYTGHAGISHLKDILETISPRQDAKVIEMIIAGDFKCGVSSSTVNKIWPGLIREYPIMLSSKTDQKLIDKLSWPACAQCLSSNWNIQTDNGVLSIKDIVESELEFKVKSYNHKTRSIEFNRVLGKSKVSNINHDWFIITLEDGTTTKPLTGNHLIFCENKQSYIRVDELSKHDIVLSL